MMQRSMENTNVNFCSKYFPRKDLSINSLYWMLNNDERIFIMYDEYIRFVMVEKYVNWPLIFMP